MMNRSPKSVLRAGALFCFSVAAQVAPAAEAYPSRPISILVADAPGTPPDIISRIIGNELTRSEGWKIVIENKAGAMQSIGATEVLRRAADGYTLLAASLPAALAPFVLQTVAARLDSDFTPVIKLGTAYQVLVVHPSVQAANVTDLVSLLQKQPDKLTFSSGGYGTPAHVTGELFKLQAHVRATHVPYQALPQAIGDLLSGVNQFQFISPLPVLELISAGKLRALAVAAPQRTRVLPDVPSVGEFGLPGLVSQDWFGLLARKGVAPELITTINRSVNKALARPELIKSILQLGAEPAGGTAEDFGEFLNDQMTGWSKVVDESGMKMSR